MSDELTRVEEDMIPLADGHMVVLAKDPQQMQVSQEHLKGWFKERLQTALAELAEDEQCLTIATGRKWATRGWKRKVKIAKGRVNFNEKALSALDAGYCIIPDFPTEIFAIRTRRKKPTKNKTTWTPVPQESEGPPQGEGEYRSPNAFIEESIRKFPGKDFNGNAITKSETTRWATEYDVPDFPMKAVKPQILDATGRAMARKLFDEIGVLPARRPRNRPGDPIVTGRILRKEGTRVIGLTFLITWWIDTRDL